MTAHALRAAPGVQKVLRSRGALRLQLLGIDDS